MINIGFIGLGGMGMHQAKTFAKAKGCRVVAGADIAEASRAKFNEAFPGTITYPTHRALLKDAKVDAVVVVSPTGLHKDIAVDAMRSGRHVLCEKPMGRTVADCHRMIDASHKTKKLLMVAHCRRYDADWGGFAKIFRSGKLGSTVVWRHINAGWGPASPWFMDDKLGGGPLIDGAVHDQDFANMLFGDPQYVVATGIKLTDSTAVDTATAIVHYKSGCQLMLSWSWGVATGRSAQDALGTKGTVIFRPELPADQYDTKTFAHYKVIDRKTKKETIQKFKRKDMYLEQAKHFLACVAGKAKCQTPGEVAIKAVASAEAILKAAKKGGAIVKVKW